MKDSKKAFLWIVNKLRDHKIKFRISGGFAARIYGSNRPLADIDIEIEDDGIKKLLPSVKEYVIEEPHRYKDDEWDVFYMVLEYMGQRIELSAANVQMVFDKDNKKWIHMGIGLKSVQKEVFGIKIPVIPKSELIKYKSIIRREVDLIDIQNIS